MEKNKMEKNKFKEEMKERFSYFLTEFIPYIVFYGILTNFAMAIIFSRIFNWYTWVGWGIGFYLIKEELPRIVRKMISK